MLFFIIDLDSKGNCWLIWSNKLCL